VVITVWQALDAGFGGGAKVALLTWMDYGRSPDQRLVPDSKARVVVLAASLIWSPYRVEVLCGLSSISSQ
jgi:hypothetical protein